ncbi:PadR family transcriptional regulator PadR [Alkalihalobacillus xiaoxiensis]|uniref:PadR family transcriptional regulator PadR n=1 Tax=Shouchella xiaoxiensis TaxID=766895 RepID=A0ABS2SMQ2_9BACI|nr:PadR family transcriptional regulator [Shouchella xiaoxiensis]MBM7836796.1 PadR family transcriptional regulator PadR [Shouchella xiaoxiensis]
MSRTQILKGILDACIMTIIKEEAVYGYELALRLQQVGLPEISDGTIYPVLLRLQKKNFIYSELKESPSGPKRKYYYLTEEGEVELETIINQWNEIVFPVNELLGRREMT